MSTTRRLNQQFLRAMTTAFATEFRLKAVMKKFTRMAMGGAAEYVVAVKSEQALLRAIRIAAAAEIPWTVIGGGTNLVVSDAGVSGLVILNKLQKFQRRKNLITLGAGENLLRAIRQFNQLGLGGMEKMAGIPGTVGGAVYGCAGAYGQEIKDCLVRVRYFDGQRFQWLRKAQCKFGYRDSIFKKHKHWVITAAQFRLKKIGEGNELQAISREIIKKRARKYPPGMRCPGSFFKNLRLADLNSAVRRRFLKKIPSTAVMYGKVPAGYLLEQVGAKGMHRGQIRVADYHANLIYNPGRGRSADVNSLANRLRKLVKAKFGVKLEEEIQYLGKFQ